jgi:glucose-1-phosphatase
MSLLFIFDMDDVLYDYDWRSRMAALSEITGHDLLELRRRWWLNGIEPSAEAGTPDTAESYLAAVTAAIGAKISIDDWVSIRSRTTHARPVALEAVRRASELGQAVLLTNNSILIHDHLHTVAPELVSIMGREHMHASAAFGARKPDPLVFTRVLQRYGVDSSSAFFTDDRPENIAGAQSIGITGHLYRDAPSLRAAIEAFALEAAAA